MNIGIPKKTHTLQTQAQQNAAETKATPETGAPQKANDTPLDAASLSQLFEQAGLPVQNVRSKEGDTLQKLARETGIPLNVLQLLNPGLPTKEPLPADTELKIPGGRKEATQASRQMAQQGGALAAQLQALLEALLNGDTNALQALAGGGAARGPTPRAGISKAGAGLAAPAAAAAGLGALAGQGGAPAGMGIPAAGANPMAAPQAAPAFPGAGAPPAGAPAMALQPDGAATLAPPTPAPTGAPQQIAATGSGPARLGPGYESLNQLSGQLSNLDGRFNPSTAKGRAAQALALAIGGTEVYSKGSRANDFFTRRGGTGNNMLGFGQFNLAYHTSKTNTPQKYTGFMGDILTGRAPMPNGRKGGDHAANLVRAVESGAVRKGNDLKNWMQQNRFGGSNWQGIDDGWSRVPGLGDQLVNFIRGGSAANAPNA